MAVYKTRMLAMPLTDAFNLPQTAYLIMFILCAVGYLAAWSLMKALVLEHKRITDL